MPRQNHVVITAKGRNLFSGLPQLFEISASDVYSAMQDTALSICNCVKSVVEKTPPDIISDVLSDAVYLSGNGALVNGMAELLSEYLKTEIRTYHDAGYAVAKGAFMALKYPDLLNNIDYQLRNINDLIVEL